MLNEYGRNHKIELPPPQITFSVHVCSPKCLTPSEGEDPRKYEYSFEK